MSISLLGDDDDEVKKKEESKNLKSVSTAQTSHEILFLDSVPQHQIPIPGSTTTTATTSTTTTTINEKKARLIAN